VEVERGGDGMMDGSGGCREKEEFVFVDETLKYRWRGL
jgi:hypothetical protein